jgi:hypothetical protein
MQLMIMTMLMPVPHLVMSVLTNASREKQTIALPGTLLMRTFPQGRMPLDTSTPATASSTCGILRLLVA